MVFGFLILKVKKQSLDLQIIIKSRGEKNLIGIKKRFFDLFSKKKCIFFWSKNEKHHEKHMSADFFGILMNISKIFKKLIFWILSLKWFSSKDVNLIFFTKEKN